MRNSIENLAAGVVFLAGIFSLITFSVAMIQTQSWVWLLGGWFIAPVTALVWPALAGYDWTLTFYVLAGVAFLVQLSAAEG